MSGCKLMDCWPVSHVGIFLLSSRRRSFYRQFRQHRRFEWAVSMDRAGEKGCGVPRRRYNQRRLEVLSVLIKSTLVSRMLTACWLSRAVRRGLLSFFDTLS